MGKNSCVLIPLLLLYPLFFQLLLSTVVFSSYLLLDPVWSHELNKRFVADYEEKHGQHCVNISEWTEPVWIDDQVECCGKKPKKMCDDRKVTRQVYKIRDAMESFALLDISS